MKWGNVALWDLMITSSPQLPETQDRQNMRKYSEGSRLDLQCDRLGDCIDLATFNLSEVVK